MLTECPSCQTVFRVTGAILKMGHGQVRCGNCRTQFDALESLLDEEDGPNEAQAARAAAKPSAERVESNEGIQVQSPAMAEEITMEGSRIEITGTYRMPSDAMESGDDPQVMHEHLVIDRDPPREAAEQSFDADEREPDEEELVEVEIDLRSDDGEPVADAARHLMDGAGEPHSSDASEASGLLPLSQRIWRRARAGTQRNEAHREIAAELDALTRNDEPRDPRRTTWIAGSAVLAVVLLVQMVHHNRDPLVRNPKWGNAISRMYRAVGLNLTPNWDLRGYELQVWDVRLDPAVKDTLRVRASVTNTASFAQPFPLLKLRLEDRWGMAVAQRAFAPEEYLPVTVSADRMMAPRQRANAEVAVVDPGADAVGFQSHPCLKQNGGLVCADDVPFVQ